MRNLLLVIDAQNDFCNPGNEYGEERGSLYVPGAHDDMVRLAKWIEFNKTKIDHIVVTMDNHHYIDISHPGFWINERGEHPEPFSVIISEDVEKGKWRSVLDTNKALNYLKKLESQGLEHVIWPPHCIIGSQGAALYPPVLEALLDWAAQGRLYQPVIKGTYPYTEHFGAFMAQVVYDEVPETRMNEILFDQLGMFDNIFVAGEARSHCVATSVDQILEFVPALASRLVILEDTMSDVPGFSAEEVYDKARSLGARFDTTENARL